MAYSKNRRLADLVATDGTMDAAKLKSGTVTQAHLHSSHGITTAHIAEGSNKYYTDERVDDRSNSLLQDGANISLTYNDSAGTLTVAATDTNTTYMVDGLGLATIGTQTDNSTLPCYVLLPHRHSPGAPPLSLPRSSSPPQHHVLPSQSPPPVPHTQSQCLGSPVASAPAPNRSQCVRFTYRYSCGG